VSSEIKKIVEALLFATDGPLTLNQILQVVENADRDIIRQAISELTKEYEFTERAFELAEVAGGFTLRTRPELSYWLRRLKKQQITRLSRASLETLAIVAYRQPVLKAEIERIRGVEVGGILRTLMNKDLVRVVGRKDLPGRPLIYGTTKRFLEVFDLKSLDDLPTMEEVAQLGGDAEMPLFDNLPMEGLEDALPEDGEYQPDDPDEYDQDQDDTGEAVPAEEDSEEEPVPDSDPEPELEPEPVSLPEPNPDPDPDPGTDDGPLAA
jgi:segregation and condensation protein B